MASGAVAIVGGPSQRGGASEPASDAGTLQRGGSGSAQAAGSGIRPRMTSQPAASREPTARRSPGSGGASQESGAPVASAQCTNAAATSEWVPNDGSSASRPSGRVRDDGSGREIRYAASAAAAPPTGSPAAPWRVTLLVATAPLQASTS